MPKAKLLLFSRGLTRTSPKHHFIFEDRLFLRPKSPTHTLFNYAKQYEASHPKTQFKSPLASETLFNRQYNSIFENFNYMAVDKYEADRIANVTLLMQNYLQTADLREFMRPYKKYNQNQRKPYERKLTFYDKVRQFYISNEVSLSPANVRLMQLLYQNIEESKFHMLVTDHIKPYGYLFYYMFLIDIANRYQPAFQKYLEEESSGERSGVNSAFTRDEALGCFSVMAHDSISKMLVMQYQAVYDNRKKISEFIRKILKLPSPRESNLKNINGTNNSSIDIPQSTETLYFIYNDPVLLASISASMDLMRHIVPNMKMVFVKDLQDHVSEAGNMCNVRCLLGDEDTWNSKDKTEVTEEVLKLSHIRLAGSEQLCRFIEAISES